jgi:uncharacterized protein (DUF736 family)
MSVIGTFVPANDGGWTGSIHTLTINAKLRFVPNNNRDSENAPAFRIFVGRSRMGDAWSDRSNDKSPKDFLRVHLDDPSLPEPLSAALSNPTMEATHNSSGAGGEPSVDYEANALWGHWPDGSE